METYSSSELKKYQSYQLFELKVKLIVTCTGLNPKPKR